MSEKQTKKERYFVKELKRKAKKANRRMRELEAKGYNSPAYQAVQSQLEMMGKRGTKIMTEIKKPSGLVIEKEGARRFSESGKVYDQNDLRQQMAVIDKFLNAKTSTRTGYEEYRQNIYESASKKYDLEKYGISQEDYEAIFEELADDEKDRMYYAEFYIEAMEAYQVKIERDKANADSFKEVQEIEENAFTVEEIVSIMENSKDYRTALSKIGITLGDIKKVKKIKK